MNEFQRRQISHSLSDLKSEIEQLHDDQGSPRVGDKRTEVALGHERQNHPWNPVSTNCHAEQRQDMRMIEVPHQSALAQKSFDGSDVPNFVSYKNLNFFNSNSYHFNLNLNIFISLPFIVFTATSKYFTARESRSFPR